MAIRSFAVILAALVLCAPSLARADALNATLTGRILSANGGLPVQSANVELDRNGKAVATATTDPNGFYHFAPQPQGEYALLISARGYQPTQVPQVFLLAGNTSQLQTAIQPSENESGSGLKQIASVVASGHSSLQETTTVNSYIDPAQDQQLAYAHPGFLLARLPGVDMHTSPSVGDDMSISIRGFDPSETATLLDDHPIGPIGAFGGANSPGFDYKLAPFWGLSGTTVIFGSGAAGMYGTSTIAGAVDFQTLTPTPQEHWEVLQGIGNYDHSMSGIQTTGTLGKLGYAFAGAVQGTTGQFPGGDITQPANMQASAWCNTPGAPTCTQGGSSYQPPDLSTQNTALNTYYVSGIYTDRNLLGKLVYSFSPRTQLLGSYFDSTSWNDKTGNGDQDALPYQYLLTLAPGYDGNNFSLNGTTTTCPSSQIAVLNNSPAGYECMTNQQYAAAFAGGYGGGPGRWNGSHMQDYHARLSQWLGKTQLTIDGFANNYNMDEHKSPVGPFYEDNYLTHGLLISDEFQTGSNDIDFGYYTQHQRHASATNFIPAVNDTPAGSYYLTSDSYFLRDTWEISPRFTSYVNLWEQHSVETAKNNFDPRITLQYRPSVNDVVRATAGRSYSEPDPALLNIANFSPSAPLSVNPSPAGELTSVGSAGNPVLQPETAVDEEVAYGHRFAQGVTMQISAYNALENNAILGTVIPLSDYPQFASFLNSTYPGSSGSWLQQYLNRLSGAGIPNPSEAMLGLSTMGNAAQAIYRGVDVDVKAGFARYFTINADWGVQSSFYKGVSTQILQNNPFVNNQAQFDHIPLQKAFASLVYENAGGLRGELDETYIATNNEFLQPAFWYADGSLSKTTGPVTVTLGVNNLFNQATTEYGEYGLGQYVPVNRYWSGSFQNALQEGGAAELYGLLPRTLWLTVSVKQ